jgi:hypothetical protein
MIQYILPQKLPQIAGHWQQFPITGCTQSALMLAVAGLFGLRQQGRNRHVRWF